LLYEELQPGTSAPLVPADFAESAQGGRLSFALKIATALLPIISGTLLTINSRFNPIIKWATLEHAQLDLRSEIYQYRTRVGEYVPRRVAQQNIMEQVTDYLFTPQEPMPGQQRGKGEGEARTEAEAVEPDPQLEALQRAARQQKGKRREAVTIPRRTCFALNVEEIHGHVLNSELGVDSFSQPGAAYAEKMRGELFGYAGLHKRSRPNGRIGASGGKVEDAREPLVSAEQGQAGERGAQEPQLEEDLLVDDGTTLVTSEDYVFFRLIPQISEFEAMAPRLGFLHAILQLATFVLAAVTMALPIFDLNRLVPLVINLTTFCSGTLEFEQLGTRLRNTNSSLLTLKNAYTWWHSLSMVEKRFPENKDFLVTVTEGTRDTEVSAWMRGKGMMRKPKTGGQTAGREKEEEDEAAPPKEP